MLLDRFFTHRRVKKPRTVNNDEECGKIRKRRSDVLGPIVEKGHQEEGQLVGK
jgi:hypothetical protein